MRSRYRDAALLRQALENRIKQQAADSATDPARLRRLVVFDRIAARLSSDTACSWVIKGGAVLEFRLRNKARMTRDLDLAARPNDGLELDGRATRELLIEALSLDEDRDALRFQVSDPADMTAETTGRRAWRFNVEATLSGNTFAKVRIDVVARGPEIALTERLTLPNFMAFAGAIPRNIEVVDARQHFAEKIHAYTRDYGAHPNTRVKDLVDLVLLIENGLLEPEGVGQTVRHVFVTRATHQVPRFLPPPPPSWKAEYPKLADGLTTTTPRLDAALKLVRGFWVEASTHS